MKKLILLLISVLLTQVAFCQIKVTQAGTIGIGTYSPYAKLQVVGNSVFTDTASQPISAAYIRGNNDYSSAITPDFTWYNNDQTGFFHPAIGTIGIAINGSEKMRLNQYGKLGINETNPLYRLDVKGDMRIQGWTDIYINWSGYSGSPVIFPETNWYLQIGKQTNRIGSGWFDDVHAYDYYEETPFGGRAEFEYIKNPMDKLKELNGITYILPDSIIEIFPPHMQEHMKMPRFGFEYEIANELFPEITYTDDSSKTNSINYGRLIPVLVEAIKIQQSQLEYLYESLKWNDEFKKSSDSNIENLLQDNILEQNKPNPFKNETQINFYIAETVSHAEIYIFNLSGKLIKTYTIPNTGKGRVIINANELNAGMYIYSLIVDSNEIDTKKMILTP